MISVSEQTSCIGCKRSFQQGQTLPPEGIHFQYKNYYLPVRQHQQRWILLKTIIAFLNSKGGTIYMGVDDATRQVIGVNAQLKQQDLFMLELDNLLQQIKPQIDLRHKQQVRVQFVPVLKDKTFQGRYIIKIIVKQGDPDKVYHFTQILKFFNEDKRHHDEQFKVLWGFYRSNMGKVDAIKGTELLREVYQKAKRPSTQFKTFHQGCNPDPLRVAVRNLNIGFKNLKDVELRTKVLQFVKQKFKVLHLQSSYFIENAQDQTVMLKFNSITEYKQADSYLIDHIDEMNSFVHGLDKIIDEGVIDNTHFYRIGIPFDPKARYRKNRSPSKIEKQQSNGDNKHKNNNNANNPKPINYIPKKQNAVMTPIKKKSDEKQHQPNFKQVEKKFNQSGKMFSNFAKQNNKIQNIKSPNKQKSSTNRSPSKQVQIYSIKFYDISQKSFSKMQSYIQNSLGMKLNSISHEIFALQDEKQIILSFLSLKELQEFLQELMANSHHQKVLNGFTENKKISFVVRKAAKTTVMHFDQNVINGSKDQKQKHPNSNKTQNQSKKTAYIPKKQLVQSPTKTYKQKPKRNSNHNQTGFHLFLTNIHPQLSQEQIKEFVETLKSIFQQFSKDSDIKILNEDLISGAVELKFQKQEEKEKFQQIIDKKLQKYENFKEFFIDGKIQYGVSNGLITLHNYKPEDKRSFKQQIQKLFKNKDFTYNSCKYVKDNEWNFSLNLTFKISDILKAYQILHKQVQNSPIVDYAFSNDGIEVKIQFSKD